MRVTKLDSANRQLAMAVRMFLNDLDPIAVHTLACASREIYEKHLVAQGWERMFDMFVGGGFLAEHPQTAIWNVINAARNFFKHPGKELSDEIEFSDEMNDLALLMACNDGAEINGYAIPEAEAFMIWISATHEAFGPAAGSSTISGRDDYYLSLDTQYPGLRDADRREKKRFGRALFSDGCRITGVDGV